MQDLQHPSETKQRMLGFRNRPIEKLEIERTSGELLIQVDLTGHSLFLIRQVTGLAAGVFRSKKGKATELLDTDWLVQLVPTRPPESSFDDLDRGIGGHAGSFPGRVEISGGLILTGSAEQCRASRF
jgi:hypothetical protein